MFSFFYPKARVTVVSSVQPRESIAINSQAWQVLGEELPVEPPPPLRRNHNRVRALAGDGIVHVSIVTGERHVHGELEEVHHEPGMLRVISENVRPQRPLEEELYRIFVTAIQTAALGLFQRQTTHAIVAATHLNKDPSAIIASYLSPM